MRRTLALLLALCFVAAACSGDDGDSTAANGADPGDCPVDALEDADGPVEVVLWNTLVAEPLRTAEELVAEYNASQDQVEVRLENQGVGYEEIQRQFNTAIGTGDLPGLVFLEDIQTQFMADSGVIVPMEACAEADDYDLDRFLPVVRSFYSVDDAVQPMSSNLSDTVLYYNRGHFTEAGLDPDDPPGTLEEMTAAAEALAEAGVSEDPFVMVLQPWYIEHWLTGSGVDMINNDNGRSDVATESEYDNETTVEIYTWLQEMHDAGLLNGVPGTEGQFDHLFAMALEQSSMTIETSAAISTIDAVLEGTADAEDLGLEGITEIPPIEIDVGVAPYPGVEQPGQVQAGGGALYMTNTTPPEVQAAAWDFVKWWNDIETQDAWSVGSSYLPWNQETIDLPEVQERWEDTRAGQWTRVAYDQIAEVDPDRPGPLIGPYTEVRTAVRESLDDLILGGASPQDAVSSASDDIDAALDRYAEENF